MFATFSRSWEFARMSYRLLAHQKKLILFPLISSIAAILVTASFILPLWQTGSLAEWMQFMDEDAIAQGDTAMYIAAFLFYFCNYFVIVFFNTGLIACVLKIMNGEDASVGYGLSVAMRRLPQVFGWALVSAVVGVLLSMIENSNKRAAAFISAILGSAWTALTYFIVPVIVVEGVGPIEAFKRSVGTLKSTWGTALVGNFTLGMISFLLMLPVIVVLVGLFWVAESSGSDFAMIVATVIAVPLVLMSVSITTTADTIFKTYLYSYATGRTLPADIDPSEFSEAFRPSGAA
jgi:hypothetical protein